MIVAGSTPTALPTGIVPGQPLTALAPMQDVTDLAFMGVVAHYGAPDYFFTEFLRVHSMSRPEKHILRSIDENATGRPVFAQLIGEDLTHLARTVDELLRHPIAGIDLNLGCPAPKVYKKKSAVACCAIRKKSPKFSPPCAPPRPACSPSRCASASRIRVTSIACSIW